VILAFARAGWLAVMLVVPLAVLAWARRHPAKGADSCFRRSRFF